MWAACFGERELRVAPWLALVPLFLLIARLPERGATWEAFRLGFAHGFATWLLGVWWIAPTLTTYGQLGTALGIAGLVLLAAYLGLFHAVFAALAARARSSSWVWTALGWAGLWTVLEVVRGWLITGFPWNLAAYAWVGVALLVVGQVAKRGQRWFSG